MAWTAAEWTVWGQVLGKGRGGTVCLVMIVLSKDLGELSGHVRDNARKRLDVLDIGAY